MSYNPQWSNGASGRVQAGQHMVKLSDASELATAINRRFLLAYMQERDLSAYIYSGAQVRGRLISGDMPLFEGMRLALSGSILSPAPGSLGNYPPSPTAMCWINAAGEVLVAGAPGQGQASFFAAVTGGTGWTDSPVVGGQTAIRAPHINELRSAVEVLTRGRWDMPIYVTGGMFSAFPDTPWIGGIVANNGTDEVRCVGFALIRHPTIAGRGLANVTVLPTSKLWTTSSRACQVNVYHCRRSLDLDNNRCTWNANLPGVENWAGPGGLGAGDATYLGSVTLPVNDARSFSGGGLAAGLQAMVDGEEQHFIFQRADTIEPYSATIDAGLSIEFTLNSPPN